MTNTYSFIVLEKERERRRHEHDRPLRSGPPLASMDELQEGGNLLPSRSIPFSEGSWFSTISIFNHVCMCPCVHVYLHMHGCVSMCVFVCMYECMHTCNCNILSHVFISMLICVFAIVISKARRALLVLRSHMGWCFL